MNYTSISRKEIEQREDTYLAPYAMRSSSSAGRHYPEEEHGYRSVYQRDKDRIIYSTAFRRLEYKTQVFVNHEGDYYRTRLTHTLEVAQIARTIARALKLNEDLVEAIALAHDLGHTPFGHSGEDALGLLMKDHGGFDHNTHGLRVVDLLEERYPNFPGLNLSHEVRRGIVRHSTQFDKKRMGEHDVKGPLLLEIQVVDIADEIAYDNHDLDDGLKSGLLSEDDLKGLELWDEACAYAEKNYSGAGKTVKRAGIVRYLINLNVSNLLENTLNKIREHAVQSANDLENISEKLVDFTIDFVPKRAAMRSALMEKMYNHYRVIRMSHKAQMFMEKIFKTYYDTPKQLPANEYNKIEQRGKEQVICDYIAGMTDRFAIDEYKKFFEPYERV